MNAFINQAGMNESRKLVVGMAHGSSPDPNTTQYFEWSKSGYTSAREYAGTLSSNIYDPYAPGQALAHFFA